MKTSPAARTEKVQGTHKKGATMKRLENKVVIVMRPE